MREEAAARDVDRVDPRFDQPLAHLHRVFQGVAGRPHVEEGDRVGVLLRADLHLQVKVVPDALPDGAHDLEDEAGAVFERSAVIVLPVVDRRAGNCVIR